jgi:hypothetical protein
MDIPFRKQLPLAGILLSLACGHFQGGPARGGDSQQTKQTRTEIHFAQILPASTILDMPVIIGKADSAGNHEAIGIVRDLLIDVNSGLVPFAVVRPIPEKEASLWVLPVSAGTITGLGSQAAAWELEKQEVQQLKSTTLDAASLPVNEDQATAWLQAFQQPRPWTTDDAIRKQAAQFDSLRGLFWENVVAPSGEKLGTITEFVLDLPAKRVAYTLLTPAGVSAEKAAGPQDETPRILIPLAAYVRSDQERTWLLELPRKDLDGEKRVPPHAFPQEMPRTWIEYVSVRYGADVEKGIQPVQQPAKREQ